MNAKEKYVAKFIERYCSVYNNCYCVNLYYATCGAKSKIKRRIKLYCVAGNMLIDDVTPIIAAILDLPRDNTCDRLRRYNVPAWDYVSIVGNYRSVLEPVYFTGDRRLADDIRIGVYRKLEEFVTRNFEDRYSCHVYLSKVGQF
jgi:hypothetical protein